MARMARQANEQIFVKRVTANLPADLLDQATALTGRSITDTLTAGLQMLLRGEAAKLAAGLKGKLEIQLDKGRRK